MVTIERYVPHLVEVRCVCRVSHTSLKDEQRLRASLAPQVIVDYSGVVPEWGRKPYSAADFVAEWLSPKHLGLKPLATQHLLGMHYFKSVSPDEIVVEWQVIASHGRRAAGEDFAHPMCRIEAQSNHRSFVEHTFLKVEGQWRIGVIKPSILYAPGSFEEMRRPEA